MNKKKKIWLAVAAVCIIGCAGGVTALIRNQRAMDAQQSLAETVKVTSSAQTSTAPASPGSTEQPVPETTAYVSPIDFKALAAISSDIYAWIEVPGTGIAYPIVQHPTDNTYYLRRSPSGEELTAGSIFTENFNSKDFTDYNTVIYGHNMKNGTMFQQLHKFSDSAFFSENKKVLIYLPDRTLSYTIFAAVPYSDEHLLMKYDFADPVQYQSFLTSVYAVRDMEAQIDKSVSVDVSRDKIITLSTCMSDNSYRLLVIAVLDSAVTG